MKYEPLTKNTAAAIRKEWNTLGDGSAARPFPGTIHAMARLIRKYRVSARDVMRAVSIA